MLAFIGEIDPDLADQFIKQRSFLFIGVGFKVAASRLELCPPVYPGCLIVDLVLLQNQVFTLQLDRFGSIASVSSLTILNIALAALVFLADTLGSETLCLTDLG